MSGQDPRRLGIGLAALTRELGGIVVPNGGALYRVWSDLLTFADATALAAGVAFTDELPVDTFVFDAGLFIPTAFDGTTPQGDVGLFLPGDDTGWFHAGAALNVGVDLATNEDYSAIAVGTASCQMTALSVATVASNNPSYLPVRITTAAPLLVIASQLGNIGGTEIDSTAGELRAWAVIALP